MADSAYKAAKQSLELIENASREEDIAAAEQDVRAAEQQLAIDQANQRLDVLFVQRRETAQANYDAAKQALRLAEIQLENTVLRAPFDGRISGKPLQVGTYLAPGVTFARVVGDAGSYFEAEIPESQISNVALRSKGVRYS